MAVTIKSPEEQQKMRVAGRLAADVLDMIDAHVAPGITTDELDRLCHDYIVDQQQAIPANVGYNGFPKTICTSVNHVVCHGIPNDRKLKLRRHRQHRRHRHPGRLPRRHQPHVLRRQAAGAGASGCRACARDAMWAGIHVVRPGARLGDIGHAIQTLTEANDFSVVREYCGHGIGRVYHEDPQVLHYGEPGTGTMLQAGHDVHHRTHDQCRQAPCAAAQGWLDRGDQGPLAVGAVGTHHPGDRRRLSKC